MFVSTPAPSAICVGSLDMDVSDGRPAPSPLLKRARCSLKFSKRDHPPGNYQCTKAASGPLPSPEIPRLAVAQEFCAAFSQTQFLLSVSNPLSCQGETRSTYSCQNNRLQFRAADFHGRGCPRHRSRSGRTHAACPGPTPMPNSGLSSK